MFSTGNLVADSIIQTVLAIGVLGGLVVGALICVGQRRPTQTVVGIRVEVIGRPIEEVFAAIEDVQSHTEWLPHVLRARKIPSKHIPKGALAAYVVEEKAGSLMIMDHKISSPMLLQRSFADRGLKCVWTYRLGRDRKSGNVLVALEERTIVESALQRGLFALVQPQLDAQIKEHLYYLKIGPYGDMEEEEKPGTATGSLDQPARTPAGVEDRAGAVEQALRQRRGQQVQAKQEKAAADLDAKSAAGSKDSGSPDVS